MMMIRRSVGAVLIAVGFAVATAPLAWAQEGADDSILDVVDTVLIEGGAAGSGPSNNSSPQTTPMAPPPMAPG